MAFWHVKTVEATLAQGQAMALVAMAEGVKAVLTDQRCNPPHLEAAVRVAQAITSMSTIATFEETMEMPDENGQTSIQRDLKLIQRDHE